MFLSYKYGLVWSWKVNKRQQIDFVVKQMTIRHWMRLGLLCRTLVRRNFHLCYGAALEQNKLLCVSNICIDIFTRFFCMHKILVHAQHPCACSCACTGPGNPGARDQARGQGPGLGPKKAAGLGPVHAQECCACTKNLCMHKNLAHAQELVF